jgi:diadenylate cyclase
MAISDFLSPKRIILRTSAVKDEIIDELIRLACTGASYLDMDEVRRRITERERDVSTNLDRGIAVPHAIFEEIPAGIMAAAVCSKGIEWDKSGRKAVHLVVLLLGSRMTHLAALGEIASILQNEENYLSVLSAGSAEEVFTILTRHDGPFSAPIAERYADASRIIFRSGVNIARSSGGRLVLHADAVPDADYIVDLVGETDAIIVTGDPGRFPAEFAKKHAVFEIPFKGVRRSVHVQFSLLFLLSEEVLKAGETVVNIYGLPESGLFDSIRINNTDESFDFTFPFKAKGVAEDFGRHVLTRVLQIAGELAREGREGKPVGALFVVGDFERVKPFTRQLIINPFSGYDEQQRNIIDPSLDETVKEFAKIDGAFVIRDDGVIVSGGTYITGAPDNAGLHPGLGARHAAALSITTVTGAFAVAISESTRKISVFHAGQKVVEI